jgi:hypothetical protein
MIADVLMAMVCWLLLHAVSRGSRRASPPQRLRLPADLPPALLAALCATMLGAFVGWTVAVERVGLGNTLSAILGEGEPIAAIVACHRRQQEFVRLTAANPAGVIMSATCPSGGQIDGTPPHVRCTLHGAAEEQ